MGTTSHSLHHDVTISLEPIISLSQPRYSDVRPSAILDIHGEPRAESWTSLSADAAANTNQLSLAATTGWRANDTVVITSTDYDMNQAEQRSVSGVGGGGQTLTVTPNLNHLHWDTIELGVVDGRLPREASVDE